MAVLDIVRTIKQWNVWLFWQNSICPDLYENVKEMLDLWGASLLIFKGGFFILCLVDWETDKCCVYIDYCLHWQFDECVLNPELVYDFDSFEEVFEELFISKVKDCGPANDSTM